MLDWFPNLFFFFFYLDEEGKTFGRPLMLASQTLFAVLFPIDIITLIKSGLKIKNKTQAIIIFCKANCQNSIRRL
jgi:hypothetical protein